MNNKIKKHLSLWMALVLLLGCLNMGMTIYADDLIPIDASTFPDKGFREAIENYYDKNGDGYLNQSERSITVMSLSGDYEDDEDAVRNVKGIEYFADTLSVLRCSYIGIQELDVSALYNLTSLTCQGNEISSLDLSNNTKLTTLNCSGQDDTLTEINLGDISSITKLHCYANKLTSLDVSNLVNLTDLRCDQNELTELDVTKNTQLQEISCSMNHLTSLDLSNNPQLVSEDDNRAVLANQIGDQTTSAVAEINGVEIVIPLEISGEENVVSSSLDSEDFHSYSMGEFLAYDVNDFSDGVDYTYYPQLDGCENMTVHVDVTRDFYQVEYYTSDNLEELIDKSFATENGSARQPQPPTAPLCKAFDCWSEDVTNVTEDMKIYVIWKDDHNYALSNFADGIATITCVDCGESSFTVVFEDCINAKPGDSNYSKYIDVVDDGYINAKDFAKLEQMF